MRHLIREGSIYIPSSAGLLARNHFFLPSRPAVAGQWNEIEKVSCYLQLPVSPGFAPGSLLIAPEEKPDANRNEYVNELYNTTKLIGLPNKF